MNELFFLLQILFAFGATLFLLRFGKGALFAWLALVALLANLFVSKQIVLFGMEVTASDAYAISLILTLNLLQEFFGKEEAKRGGMVAVMVQVAFLIFAKIHLLFTPSVHDSSQPYYEALLAAYPRLLFASCITFYLVQLFDRRCFAKLSVWLKNASFGIRNALSIACSQFLDTGLFTLLGLYGLVANPLDVFLMSFAVKVLLISLLPFLTLLMIPKQPKAYDVSI